MLADAARTRNDVDAIRLLNEQLVRFPGNAAITSALTGRQRARDVRISELVQRARGANDAKAVEFLDSALALDSARADVRTERNGAPSPSGACRSKAAREVLNRLESRSKRAVWRSSSTSPAIARRATSAGVSGLSQYPGRYSTAWPLVVQPDAPRPCSARSGWCANRGGGTRLLQRPMAVEDSSVAGVARYRSGTALAPAAVLGQPAVRVPRKK